jgi:hypothetical protein
MIQPGNYDLVIQQNGDFEQIFQFKDSDGDPLNLTGYTVESEIWTESRGVKLYDFTVAIVSAALGQCKLSLTDAQTGALVSNPNYDPRKPLYYDIRLTDGLGQSSYWVRGLAIFQIGYTA